MMFPRTSEGRPNHCPWCGFDLISEPSAPAGETPCPRCGHWISFTFETQGDVLVIKPTGKKLELPMLPGPVAPSPKRVVIDLGETSGIVSADLAKLLKLKMQLVTAGGTLALRHLQPGLMKVFRIARLDTIFEFEG